MILIKKNKPTKLIKNKKNMIAKIIIKSKNNETVQIIK